VEHTGARQCRVGAFKSGHSPVTAGTSGSPWVTRFNTRSRTGTIVGVIGGYQQGGDTPSVSYSALFGSDIHQLYEQAIAEGTASGQA
jgi:hypothetical protein